MLPVALAAFAALLPITNPIGALAAFAGLTGSMDARDVHRQAWRTGLYVGGILIVFALAGTYLLSFLGIGLPALQVAGGLVVMYSGFTMLTPRENLSDDEHAHAVTKTDVSFSPMALPLVAGPGAIGVVIALAARQPDWLDRFGIVIACAAMAALIAIILRYGTALVDKLGPTGIGAITRIMGFLILAIGAEIGLHGVVSFVADSAG